MSAEDMKMKMPIVKVMKAYSKPKEPKKNKIRIMTSLDSEVSAFLTGSLCLHGGVRKCGLPPRGGATRELRMMLDNLIGAEAEVEDDE